MLKQELLTEKDKVRIMQSANERQEEKLKMRQDEIEEEVAHRVERITFNERHDYRQQLSAMERELMA